MPSSRMTSQSRQPMAGRNRRPLDHRTAGGRPMGNGAGGNRAASQPTTARRSNGQRPPANRQVRWQSSQPSMGQNPFMMDDFDDIPVALREGNAVPQRSATSKWRWVIVGGSLAGAVGLSMGIAAAFFNANVLSTNQAQAEPEGNGIIAAMGNEPLNGDRSNPSSILGTAPGDQASAGTPSASGTTTVEDASGSLPTADNTTVKTILGHYPFEEAAETELSDLGGGLLLNSATAAAFRKMRAAAQADGIDLVPLSGFRSISVQQDLFFGVKAERGQTASERAKVSAPPGHSEHHTGYAVDIGDARDRSTDLSERFENTTAFAWLQQNAPYYSFELSFPKGNKQGVNYEPWHWRYVGDQASLELFHRDR